MLVAVIAEAIAIALLGLLVIGLLRSHALILNALHELGAGLELEQESSKPAPASTRPTEASPRGTEVELEPGVMPSTRVEDPTPHDIVGTTLQGDERRVPVSGAGKRTLMAFLSSGCSVCQTFWDEFRAGNTDVPGNGELVIVTKGPDMESPSSLAKLAGDLEIVQSSGAWTDYDIPGSPYFVYVEDGRITGEGSSTTWTQVRDLMGQAVDDAQARRRSATIRLAPDAAIGRTVEEIGRGARDDISRIDQELSAAGLTKDDPSLYLPPDAGSEETDVHAGHHHDHTHDHNHTHDHDGRGRVPVPAHEHQH